MRSDGGSCAAALRPHFLHVAASSETGGIERCSVDLARLLQERGGRVTFACSPGGFVEARCHAAGIATLPFRPRNSGDLAAARRLACWSRDNAVALVHVHYRRDYLVAALGTIWAHRCASRRPRLVLHAHLVGPLGRPPRLSGWFYGRTAQAVVAVSGAVSDCIESTFPFPAGFVRPIPNGVSAAAFAAPGSSEWAERRADVRRQWGVPESALVVGMVGRLRDKGQEALLAAASGLLSRFPGLWLVLVGPGCAEPCRAQAEASGIGRRVILPGSSENIPAVMAGFDALAHLPADEAFGLALAEAMAAGLPTVATAVGGCREVVGDGVTGLLVPLGDSEALRDRLARLLDHGTGAALRRSLGRAGRRRVECEFSNEQWVMKMLHLYGELLAR